MELTKLTGTAAQTGVDSGGAIRIVRALYTLVDRPLRPVHFWFRRPAWFLPPISSTWLGWQRGSADETTEIDRIETMFAVIRTGGRQYRVAKDDIITVGRLAGEAGDKVTIADVLAVGEGADVQFGKPMLEGATVTAELVEQKRGPKIIVFIKKRRKNYRRKKGHRQDLTQLKITGIAAGA